MEQRRCSTAEMGAAKNKTPKTYNSGDSPVVTHLTTSPPVRCLNRAERTGSLVFNVLWSYVKDLVRFDNYIPDIKSSLERRNNRSSHPTTHVSKSLI
jgi:hypothetical protein